MPLMLFPISSELTTWFGVLGCILLMFTPGAWATFAATLGGIPFWAKLFTGAMLSPLFLCAEFYAVRLTGVPFSPTTIILVFLNLPVLYFIWRRRGKWSSLNASDWVFAVLVVLVSAACMISILIRTDARIFSPHSWYHTDPIYMFARGQLVPESPTLAGMRLSYPVWTPLVASAVQSFLLAAPPMSSYIWGDLFGLTAIYAFAAGITRELGGGKLAQFSSGIWLFLGTNPIGYILMKLAPRGGTAHQIWGDPRYTPWVGKFHLLSPMTLGLGMLMAMIYFLIRSGPLTRSVLVIIGLLLCGIGLLYPLLLPPACAVVSARALAPLAQRKKCEWPYREWMAWAGLLLIAALLTFGEVTFMTASRQVSTSAVLLSSPGSAVRKLLASLLATSLLLAGVAFTIRERQRVKPVETIFLVVGAVLSYALYVTFFIPFYENEYKFIFVACMCLFAFPAIAVEKIWNQWPRSRAVALLAILVFLVVGAQADYMYINWPSPWIAGNNHREPIPNIDLSTFQIRLKQPFASAGICDAVRRMTPPDSVLLLSNGSFYYPAFTDRSLYVAPKNLHYPGVNLFLDDLDADVRGYGRRIIQQRRATMADVFNGTSDARRKQALDVVLALKRPVAIVVELQHEGLLKWLESSEAATRLYAQNGLSLWLTGSTSANLRLSRGGGVDGLPGNR